MDNLPLLSLLSAAPAAGAVLLLAVPSASGHVVRGLSVGLGGLPALIAMALWFAFEPRGPQWQFSQQLEIFAGAGIRYAVGMDGLALLLVVLTSLVVGSAIATGPVEGERTWSAALLFMEAGVLGALVSLDMLQMLLFWQVAIAALVVLTGISEQRGIAIASAAIAVAGGLAMVAGVLMLRADYRSLASVNTFDIRAYQMATLPKPAQTRLFVLLALAFATPLALVFLQLRTNLQRASSWLLALVTSALLVKLGIFGFLRILLPVVPDASRAFAPAIVIVGLVSAAIAACVTVRAPARIGLYLAGIGQLALAMAAVFALTPDALTGGLVYLFAHGLTMGALFVMIGANVNSIAIAIAAMAGGFTGARLIASGLLPFGGTTVAASVLANVIIALALLVIARRASATASAPVAAAHRIRVAVAAPFLVLSVAIAAYPAPLLARLETSVARIVMRVSPEYSSQVADCLNQPVPPPPASGLPAGMMLAAPCTDGSNKPAEPAKKP